MPGGRPTKYKKRYCEDVIEHMKNGASFTSFAAKIQVADSRIRDWKKRHPEFRAACNIAEKRSQDWWENFAMQSATGRLYDKVHKGKYDRHNPGMIQFIMKQRFYRDYNRAPHADKAEEKTKA
jgi:hypothetical protein